MVGSGQDLVGLASRKRLGSRYCGSGAGSGSLLDMRTSQPATLTRRKLLRAGAGFAAAGFAARSVGAVAAPALTRPGSEGVGFGTWPLPAHDLGATRQGGRVA